MLAAETGGRGPARWPPAQFASLGQLAHATADDGTIWHYMACFWRGQSPNANPENELRPHPVTAGHLLATIRRRATAPRGFVAPRRRFLSDSNGLTKRVETFHTLPFGFLSECGLCRSHRLRVVRRLQQSSKVAHPLRVQSLENAAIFKASRSVRSVVFGVIIMPFRAIIGEWPFTAGVGGVPSTPPSKVRTWVADGILRTA